MNFYSSPAFLLAASDAYYPNRRTKIELVRIGDEVLRLLVVDDKEVVTSLPFLDYHVPLSSGDVGGTTRDHSYVRLVEREIVTCDDWRAGRAPGADVAPFVDWSLFRCFSDYMGAAKTHSRVKEYLRRGRKLAKDFGEVRFTENDLSDDVLELGIAWKRQQLEETGGKDWTADPKNTTFLRLLKERGQLISSTMRVDGVLAAVWLGFVHDGTWSGWVFTHNPQLRKYSMGHQLLFAMLERSYLSGCRQFDFSIGAEEYKLLYATHVRVLDTIGSVPFRQRILGLANKPIEDTKAFVKRQTPQLYRATRNLKREVQTSLATRFSELSGRLRAK